jgi:anti-anti-sigma regulatory factor
MPQKKTDLQVMEKLVVATLSGEYGFDELVNLSCILGSRWSPSSQGLVLDFSKVIRVDGEGARFFMTNLNLNVQHGGTVYLVKAPKEIRRCVVRFGGAGKFRSIQSAEKVTRPTRKHKETPSQTTRRISRRTPPLARRVGT